MNTDEKYIQRCLQLAENGKGYVSPNPMVGAVVVCEGKIIGEGFHREYGKAHAEVNAISSVKDKLLLSESTIYVSLEPCSHYGKTPPCSQLIIDSKIKRVVIATPDPYKEVSGRGIKMLREAGIDVTVGILEKEAYELNKAFFSAQLRSRPYVYLKWAQTQDGFIDKLRQEGEEIKPTPISNSYTKMLVHKLRSEVSAIMIGTNTALNDNPSLTTRDWYGKNPVRIVLDRQGRIPTDYTVFDNKVKTIVFTEKVDKETIREKTVFIPMKFDDMLLNNILDKLHSLKIDSVLVEGGQQLLQSFIDQRLWDEAFIEVADKEFYDGVKAPIINGDIMSEKEVHGSTLIHLKK